MVSILVIFSFFFGPRGTSTVTISSRLLPEQGAADRRLVRELLLGRVGLGRADDLELLRLLGLLVLDVDDDADRDRVGVEVLRRRSGSPCAGAPRASRSAVSSRACSFFASSYSEFSVMSPNSRASLIRSATSLRRTWSRAARPRPAAWSSPSLVIGVSRATSRDLSWLSVGFRSGRGPTYESSPKHVPKRGRADRARRSIVAKRPYPLSGSETRVNQASTGVRSPIEMTSSRAASRVSVRWNASASRPLIPSRSRYQG